MADSVRLTQTDELNSVALEALVVSSRRIGLLMKIINGLFRKKNA